jgi:exonuclease III
MVQLLKIVSWNTKVGRGDKVVGDNLHDLIQDTDPDVICLQEADGYVDMLKNRYGDHWWVYAKNGWEESQHNPVMVRKSVDEKKTFEEGWNVARYTTKWHGPQGGSHNGRTWTFVNVNGIWVMSFHRCTDGNGKNKAAFQDEFDRVVKWSSNRSKPWIIFGDHNCGPKKTFKGASKNIANKVGGKIRHDGGIDYAITKNLKGSVNHLNKSYGSDHAACVFKQSE